MSGEIFTWPALYAPDDDRGMWPVCYMPQWWE